MKKILLLITVLISLWCTTFAQAPAAAKDPNYDDEVFGTNLNITTYTSEPCGMSGQEGYCTGTGQMKRCKCTLSASSGFIDFISEIYKYIFFISLIIGVLMIVILGVGMSLSGIGSEEMKAGAKKKIFEILAGLGALGLAPLILKTVAPFFFN